MTSKVYFIDFKASFSCNIFDKFEALFNRADFPSLFKPKDLVACKIHFGEEGNITFIRPIFIKKLIELIKSNHCYPFLTDTSTLYVGARSTAPSHIELAIRHGFNIAPIIIADGLRGENGVNVKINLKHFKEVKIASGIYYADALVVISHFKGHMEAGFGGAIKNLGMGCSTKEGKLEMHSGFSPVVSSEKCKSCGSCIRWCPVTAIKIDEVAQIMESKCIGCGTCIAVCPYEAIEIKWGADSARLQETIAEHAKGSVSNKSRVGYINFLMDISKLCDCAPTIEPSIFPDVGILASFDPVSIDQASFDLINSASDGSFGKIWHNTNPELQLQYAEQIGLGTRKYELIKN
jgi:hypothetical protein